MRQIDVKFPFSASMQATPTAIDLTLDQVAFYPADSSTQSLICQSPLVIPTNWQHAKAVATATRDGDSKSRRWIRCLTRP